MIFTETWKADASKINIHGYWDYSQIIPKHKNSLRHSRGITVLAKHIITPGIKVVKNTEGFLWFKLDKNFFQTDNGIFLCGAYIPPKNTTKNILLFRWFWTRVPGTARVCLSVITVNDEHKKPEFKIKRRAGFDLTTRNSCFTILV